MNCRPGAAVDTRASWWGMLKLAYRPLRRCAAAWWVRLARVVLLLLILTSLGFTSDHPAPPPAYVSRVWRTQDGLPESRIRAIAQTPDGYLWIGTPGGLARFDGVRFVVYSRFN